MEVEAEGVALAWRSLPLVPLAFVETRDVLALVWGTLAGLAFFLSFPLTVDESVVLVQKTKPIKVCLCKIKYNI